MSKKIDILMATYNGSEYISEQINSIINQTYSNFRLVVCDDNSQDDTYVILKEYEKKDDRIIVSKNEKNLGYIKNYEKLLSLVENEYFMLADQDDVWYSTKIEDSLNLLNEKNADLIFTDLEVVDEKLNLVNKSFNNLMNYKRKILSTDDYNRIYLYNVITGCTILSKSKYINYILPLPNNKNLIHDHYIPLLVALKGGRIEYLDKATIKYRQHRNNQVGTSRYISKLKSFNEIRNHLIDVKISIFSEYVRLERIFDEKLNKENKIALSYFYNLKNIKILSFKGINTYFKLYRYESVTYKLLYMFIFHFPCLCKMVYGLVRIFIKKR